MKKDIIVAGAAPDSGNLGVSALCDSFVTEFMKTAEDTEINILDFGNRVRKNAYRNEFGITADLIGAKLSNKLYKPSSFQSIDFLLRNNLIINETVKKFKNATCIYDVSGGDSFTDMYGAKRLKSVSYPKNIALRNNIPLILLPQTYGPFKSKKNEDNARKLISYSKLAFARDVYSYEYLREIMKDEFDVSKIKLGVDLAFLLTPSTEYKVPFSKKSNEEEIFGINISGLLYNDTHRAKKQYGINSDYKSILKELVETILTRNEGRIILVPHVITKSNDFECDLKASQNFLETIKDKHKTRVSILNGNYNQSQIKKIISNFDWFCGSRMHATIASLSSGVPTVNIAYSDKSKGVFACLDQEEKVIDARKLKTENIITSTINEWEERKKTKQIILEKLPKVLRQAKSQIIEMKEAGLY